MAARGGKTFGFRVTDTKACFFAVSAANTFPHIKLHSSSTGTTLIDVMLPDFWQQPTGITKRVHVS